MKKLIFYSTFLMFSSCFPPKKTISEPAKDFELVWKDEFDNTGLPDSTIWNYDIGGDGWGNQELQFYTAQRLENARCENGHLIIEARKETWGKNEYTSARLVTRDKKPILYGKIDVKARLPKGRGSWPAIWMLGQNIETAGWPLCGEIDIMEHVGFDPNRVHGSVHTKAYHHSIKTHKTAWRMVETVSEAFHVYSVVWSPNYVEILIDDVPFFRFDKEPNADLKKFPFVEPQYLLLNVAIGGFWGGEKGIDPNLTSAKMEVDYVRVFKIIEK